MRSRVSEHFTPALQRLQASLRVIRLFQCSSPHSHPARKLHVPKKVVIRNIGKAWKAPDCVPQSSPNIDCYGDSELSCSFLNSVPHSFIVVPSARADTTEASTNHYVAFLPRRQAQAQRFPPPYSSIRNGRAPAFFARRVRRRRRRGLYRTC